MVCDTGVHASGQCLAQQSGVPAAASQGTWSSVGAELPHCPYCGAFVSPSTGVCNNRSRCPKYGNQVREPMGWPPANVRFTMDKSKWGKPVTIPVGNTSSQAQPQAQTQPAAQSIPAQPQPQGQPAARAVQVQPQQEGVPNVSPAVMQPTATPQMRAFAQMQQKAQGGNPVQLEPLSEEAALKEKRREVERKLKAIVDNCGVQALDSDNNVKDGYLDTPVAQEYQKAKNELDALEAESQRVHSIDLGNVVLGVDQPADGVAVTKKDYWGSFEFGDKSKLGTQQELPCSHDLYDVGRRWKAGSGVAAQEGRQANTATTAGAISPMAADLLAYNGDKENVLEKDGLVLWHGDTFNGPHSPSKCPNCGKFVSPGKPCAHCGYSGAFAAVYDRETNESACFVPGCPGVVDGKPCSHQMGARLAASLTDGERGKYRSQFATAINKLRQSNGGSTVVEDAVHAGDAAYVLMKEAWPDEEMTFGSKEAAARANQVFGAEVQSSDGKAKEASVTDRIGEALGSPEAPVPSQSNREPAKHSPYFVMTDQVEETMEMMGGALRLGYSPNARGMMGRTFGFFGPPGTGKNEMLRETAATLEMPYREIDLGRGADLQALIGEVVLEPDGRGGTRSVAKLGPLGKALTQGEVVALNEIIHTDPDSQTLLHQITQEGKIQLHNPEGADQVYDVHPSSILGVTWNPKGGIQDRPSEALYSRLFTRRVGYPDPEEEQRRLLGWAEGQGIPHMDDDAVERTITFVNDLRELSVRGGLDVPPTFRDAQRFVTQWKLTGSINQGLEQMRGLASQLDDHDLQWDEVNNLFARTFGDLVA